MPNPDRVTIDPDKPLTVSIMVRSDRIGLAYKLWTRKGPSDSWTTIGDGVSDDLTADTFDLGVMPAGSTLAFWLAMGGPKGKPYQIDLLFLQDGKPLAGGVPKEVGTIPDDEVIALEGRVALL